MNKNTLTSTFCHKTNRVRFISLTYLIAWPPTWICVINDVIRRDRQLMHNRAQAKPRRNGNGNGNENISNAPPSRPTAHYIVHECLFIGAQ